MSSFLFLYFYFQLSNLNKISVWPNLPEADVKETAESSKKHTYDLLKKIRKHLSSIGMEAAALPKDQAQKYILAVSNSNVN